MQFSYTSHSGASFDLFGDSYFGNPDAFLESSMSVDSSYSTVKRAYRDKQEHEVDLTVSGGTKAETLALYRSLVSAFDDDALNGTPGTLNVAGYEASAYAVSHSVDFDEMDDYTIPLTVGFVVDGARWVKRTTTVFRAVGAVEGVDYPMDYPHDEGFGGSLSAISNGSGIACLPIISFHGPCDSPRVSIKGNVYGIDDSCADGESLVIDAESKTIAKIDAASESSNIFAKYYGTMAAGSGSYAFQPVQNGRSEVLWDGTFEFAVTLAECRLSPIPEVFSS